MEQQCFSSFKNQKKLLLNFRQILQISYKNGNTKDCTFIGQSWEWIFKICSKKWYIIDSESKGSCSHYDPIKFLTKSIESSHCDYSDAYILVTGNITVTRTIAAVGNCNNCAPFKDCRTEINVAFVDYTDFINIAIPMYDLIEYSDNYSDSSGSLWDFKRDKLANNANVTDDDNAPSFKYKADLIADTEANEAKKE